MGSTIGYTELTSMFSAAIKKVRANIKELSALDAAIGDGDHGTTMSRAMNAVEKTIKESDSESLQSLLHNIGWGVMSIDGGCTGPLIGSLFMGMSDSLEGLSDLDCSSLVVMLEAGLSGVQVQSKAKIGDKTMMDSLIPAVEAARQACDSGKSIPEVLAESADVAEKGAASTKDFIARFGRARNLGDRTIGCQDPGATTISLLFRGFSDSFK
ncbi:MAG: dihydroxyacetone kinase subunit DhaL [bacterium]